MTSARSPSAIDRARPRTASESAALVISRALSADRTSMRADRRNTVALALSALLAVAGVTGYLAGNSGSAPAERRTAEADAVRLTLPGGWTRREPARGIETMAQEPLVAGPAGKGSRRLIAARLSREGLSLLPSPARKRLADVSGGEPVRLGRIRAARYRAVEATAPRRRVTLYAMPTSRGVALAACVAPPAAWRRFAPGCERAVAALSVPGARPSRLAAAQVAPLNRALAGLDAERAAAGRQLGSARSPAQRARIVQALAAAHGVAAGALGDLPAGSEARRSGVAAARALRGVEAAYYGLAEALGANRRARREAARRTLLRRDAALRRAIERL